MRIYEEKEGKQKGEKKEERGEERRERREGKEEEKNKEEQYQKARKITSENYKSKACFFGKSVVYRFRRCRCKCS